jgi:hypothetical protein
MARPHSLSSRRPANSRTWRFSPGLGSILWATVGFDDSAWAEVAVPSDWRDYGYTSPNATGWFRRSFTLSPAQLAAAEGGRLRLALGDVAVTDITFINGVQVPAPGPK